MSTNLDVKNKKPHSAEYFGDYRDYWWNEDFLELMAKRLALGKAETVLDVGCGIGHWGQLLAPHFSQSARVIGVDREEAWVKNAKERAHAQGLGDRYDYRLGDALALPFGDSSFDVVTCQTVLIHLKDPRAGILEMLRVLKPGGLVLVAEPNNIANRTVSDNQTESFSVEEILDRLRFGLILERGKKALGLGFNSLGDLVPGYLAELQVEEIQVYLSDKAVPIYAPYSKAEQRVHLEQLRVWTERGFLGAERDELRRDFLAGGGSDEDFERYCAMSLTDSRMTLDSVEDGSYHSAGGTMMYLVSGRKPKLLASIEAQSPSMPGGISEGEVGARC